MSTSMTPRALPKLSLLVLTVAALTVAGCGGAETEQTPMTSAAPTGEAAPPPPGPGGAPAQP
ncbi:MAG: hypothetical protein KC502_05315, partial [Myxococcales bacterium]|nr:hypothetical protein [Myxococcales bacterium]